MVDRLDEDPDPAQMRSAIRLCRCLSDPIALRVCLLLRQKPRGINELQSELGMSRAQVNERLRKLRECLVIDIERDGRWLTFFLMQTALPIIDKLMGG